MYNKAASRRKGGGAHFLEPPQSISDQIYEMLKRRILLGEIEAGERLMQNQVAEDLKASRTPVREAFRRLEQDGLVERVPQGGVRVTPLDPETLQEVFGIRRVLEAYAVELACGRITDGEISALKRLLDQARELLASSGLDWESRLKSLFELNNRFHDTVYLASGNSYLMTLIGNLRNIVRRLRLLGMRGDSNWSQVWDEHGQLIELLEKKDKDEAVRLIKRHLVSAAAHVASGLRAQGEDPGAAAGGPG